LHLAITTKPVNAWCPPEAGPVVCAVLPSLLEPLPPVVGTPLTEASDGTFDDKYVTQLDAIIEMSEPPSERRKRDPIRVLARRRRRRWLLRRRLRQLRRLRRLQERQLQLHFANARRVHAYYEQQRLQTQGQLAQMQMRMGALEAQVADQRWARRALVLLGIGMLAYMAWRAWLEWKNEHADVHDDRA
jgi:hypothetical protein